MGARQRSKDDSAAKLRGRYWAPDREEKGRPRVKADGAGGGASPGFPHIHTFHKEKRKKQRKEKRLLLRTTTRPSSRTALRDPTPLAAIQFSLNRPNPTKDSGP